VYKLAKRDRQYLDTWRGRYSPDVHWFAVMVNHGRERQIHQSMLADAAEHGLMNTLLPEVVLSGENCAERNEAALLFPCYLFVQCRMTDTIYLRLTSYSGVVSVLGRAWRIPSALDDREIQWLKGMLFKTEKPELITRKDVGAQAEIASGIMRGMRGRIIEASAHHVKLEVRLSFLNGQSGIAIIIPKSEILITDPRQALVAAR
jgi:transcription antitermination factor NusG